MKSVPVVILAILAVVYSLAVLILVDPASYRRLPNNQERVSEVVLGFMFKR
jgi:hypothetical protein